MAVFQATDATLDQHLGAAEFVVVDFYGDNCGGCVYMEPFYLEASIDMPYIRFVKINITHNREAARRFDIQSMPTVKMFHNGEEVHAISSGRIDRKVLNENLAKLLYAGF